MGLKGHVEITSSNQVSDEIRGEGKKQDLGVVTRNGRNCLAWNVVQDD